MNARGQRLDKTHLSIDQAEERGFIHRDYLAHCLRYSHVCRHLTRGKLYETVRLIDVGCGRDQPLPRMMYTSRLVPKTGRYLGIDANRLELSPVLASAKFPIELISGIFPACLEGRDDRFDVAVCLEVCEHVEPAMTLQLLRGLLQRLDVNGTTFVSTPCYDPHTGAAANHVNEMSHRAFGSLLEYAGFRVDAVWGTFASQRDYEHRLGERGLVAAFHELQEYFDSNYLATIFAPLFPESSRNCLWRLKRRIGDERRFPPLPEFASPAHSSSAEWPGFVDSLNEGKHNAS